MKNPLRPLALSVLLVITAAFAGAADSRVIELRTYWSPPGKLEALLTRFQDHTLALFEKHGMENIVYWVPADAKDGAGEKLVYLIGHRSREAAKASWAAFGADPEWQRVSAASQVDGRIVSKVESKFLTVTDYSPVVTAAAAGQAAGSRVFELRTYTTPEGKLGALDARFGGGETALFEKHGMKGIGYFHPQDAGQGAGRTLVYVLAHASREAAAASWKGFREDPEWIKMKADTEQDGRLAEKVESLFLVPVGFSPVK